VPQREVPELAVVRLQWVYALQPEFSTSSLFIRIGTEGQGHGGPLISRLQGQSGDHGLVEIQEHKIVQLAGLVPRPLLRRVREHSRTDEDVARRSLLSR
jgi:hypothetical protein